MLKKDPLEKRMCFIWPKDGPKGNRPRGFFSGLSDIITNKGPDIFIQKGNSKRPITPEIWSNWDSYHSFDAHLAEDQYSKPLFLGGRSRGIKRYDPHSRKYKTWDCSQDWNGCIRKRMGWYPRFTESEMETISSTPASQRLGTEDFGPDWGSIGPMRFGPEYDYFWGNAHRMGENRFYGLDSTFSPAPYYAFHQTSPFDIQRWINQRGIVH